MRFAVDGFPSGRQPLQVAKITLFCQQAKLNLFFLSELRAVVAVAILPVRIKPVFLLPENILYRLPTFFGGVYLKVEYADFIDSGSSLPAGGSGGGLVAVAAVADGTPAIVGSGRRKLVDANLSRAWGRAVAATTGREPVAACAGL